MKYYLIELKIVKKDLWLLMLQKKELINLIKKRSNTYSKALHEIKCDNLSKNQIVKNILKTS